MAQYKSYTHVLRIDKDEVQGILCGDVVVMPKLDGTNACLFMKDGTVHAGSRTRESILIMNFSSLMYLTQQRMSIFRTMPTKANLETMTKLFL